LSFYRDYPLAPKVYEHMFVESEKQMNKEQLAAWVSEGLSLEQIGRLVGRHRAPCPTGSPSTDCTRRVAPSTPRAGRSTVPS